MKNEGRKHFPWESVSAPFQKYRGVYGRRKDAPRRGTEKEKDLTKSVKSDIVMTKEHR